MTRAYLIAGEASGEALGAALMAGLKALDPAIAFSGVAVAAADAAGLFLWVRPAGAGA